LENCSVAAAGAGAAAAVVTAGAETCCTLSSLENGTGTVTAAFLALVVSALTAFAACSADLAVVVV
jgi:hypothetical protein